VKETEQTALQNPARVVIPMGIAITLSLLGDLALFASLPMNVAAVGTSSRRTAGRRSVATPSPASASTASARAFVGRAEVAFVVAAAECSLQDQRAGLAGWTDDHAFILH